MDQKLEDARMDRSHLPTIRNPRPNHETTKHTLHLINNKLFCRTRDIPSPPIVPSWVGGCSQVWPYSSQLIETGISFQRRKGIHTSELRYSCPDHSLGLPVWCPKRGYIGWSHEISPISSPSWTEYRACLDLPEWVGIRWGYGLAVTVASVS